MASLPDGTTAPRGLPPPAKIHWPLVASRDLFELRYGKALVESMRQPGSVPVYGTNGRCGSHDEALFKGPGVILGRKGQGPLGVEWSGDGYWVIDTAYSLAPLGQRVDLKFAYFLIKHIGLNHLKDGTSNPTLSRDAFGAQALPIPPLDQQRAIAHILGTLDDKIELNRRMSGTLEAMARALFQSWFVDFDPVRAKMEGRDPGLPKRLADLFPARLVDSELGGIPEGWGIGSILDQATLLSGGTPKTGVPEYWDGAIPWASAKDVSQCGEAFLVSTERTITTQGLEESATQIIPALSTVVVARGATTGRMALLGRDMAMNQTCYGLTTTTETPFALHCQLRHDMGALVHAAHGSVFDTITTKTFSIEKVVVVPPPLLKVFEEQAAPTLLRVLRSAVESRTLATLRDALLPKLVSGELRIREAERFLRDAT